MNQRDEWLSPTPAASPDSHYMSHHVIRQEKACLRNTQTVILQPDERSRLYLTIRNRFTPLFYGAKSFRSNPFSIITHFSNI